MIGSRVIIHRDSLEKNSFCRSPQADQACGLFSTLRKAGMLAFPRGDGLAIENHFGDILMAFCCISAIVYESTHITSLRKSPSDQPNFMPKFTCNRIRASVLKNRELKAVRAERMNPPEFSLQVGQLFLSFSQSLEKSTGGSEKTYTCIQVPLPIVFFLCVAGIVRMPILVMGRFFEEIVTH